MNLNELLQKLESESGLNEQEQVLLDQLLAESEGVKASLQHLEEDQLSMAWRSELSSKLATMPVAPKPRWLVWIRPVAGLALAGALATVAFLPKSIDRPAPVQADVERELVSLHREVVTNRDVTEFGLTAYESRETKESDSLHDWSEADLGIL
ncbi:MAG TPA: hypothetical protein PKA27_08080 [Fimbriimonadaceae bacterium]|nr:hypothetical protein [Fimbriimonadaceae bacterium]